MKIQSSTLDAHQFALVRRRGYDPAEVDAVMNRLAETLREYEVTAAGLQSRLRDAEESSEAITRAFVAAQRTKEEMVAEAQTEADVLLRDARNEVSKLRAESKDQTDALLDEARRTLNEARAEAASIRTDANEIMTVAKAKAEEVGSRADQILTSAMAEAEQARDDAARVLAEHQRKAEETLTSATDEAHRQVAAANIEAETRSPRMRQPRQQTTSLRAEGKRRRLSAAQSPRRRTSGPGSPWRWTNSDPPARRKPKSS